MDDILNSRISEKCNGLGYNGSKTFFFFLNERKFSLLLQSIGTKLGNVLKQFLLKSSEIGQNLMLPSVLPHDL